MVTKHLYHADAHADHNPSLMAPVQKEKPALASLTHAEQLTD